MFKGNAKVGVVLNKRFGYMDTKPRHAGFTLNSDTPYGGILLDLSQTGPVVMVRAIARQAEAERQRRAKIVNAEGEQQAAENLMQAARKLMERPQSIQLRYLQTLVEIAGDKTSTIAFPLPLDLIGPLLDHRRDAVAGTPAG